MGIGDWGFINSNHRKKIDIIKQAYNFAMRAHEGQ